MPGNPISPEAPRDFNRRLIATLEELGVVYAIGGSVAATMYSEPRLTMDVDVVVSASLSQLSLLVREIQSWQVDSSPLETIVETSIPYGLPFKVRDMKQDRVSDGESDPIRSHGIETGVDLLPFLKPGDFDGSFNGG